MTGMILQALSLAGAAMLLAAYLALQRKWLSADHRAYNALNLVGSGLLAIVAWVDQRWGFIVLEATWAMLSVPPLVRGRRVE